MGKYYKSEFYSLGFDLFDSELLQLYVQFLDFCCLLIVM